MSLLPTVSPQILHTKAGGLHSLPYTSQPFKLQNLNFSNLHRRPNHCSHHYHRPFLLESLTRGAIVLREERLLLRKCCDNENSSSPGKEDDQAIQAVNKLYNAIKNRDIGEVSEILGDDCRCACNFIPFLRSCHGKEQVVAFFCHLIKILGNNIEFVFLPTSKDGMTVSVAWKLEWNNLTVPLGKGVSFNICQVYQGKAVIRNVEMFMEPFLHLEPSTLKLAGYMMKAMEMIKFPKLTGGKLKRAAFMALLLLAALFFSSKFLLY